MPGVLPGMKHHRQSQLCRITTWSAMAVHQENPVRRLIVSTYQAASGGGALMEELELSTRLSRRQAMSPRS
jgi:aspartate-semialdehyde dehydrogenase